MDLCDVEGIHLGTLITMFFLQCYLLYWICLEERRDIGQGGGSSIKYVRKIFPGGRNVITGETLTHVFSCELRTKYLSISFSQKTSVRLPFVDQVNVIF